MDENTRDMDEQAAVPADDDPELDPSEGSEAASAQDIADDEVTLKGLFESVLFMATEPVPISFFVKNFSLDQTQATIIMESLRDDYEERDGGIRLVEIANGFQMITNPRYAEQLRHALGLKRRETLSRGMLETLAIIAYKQPVVLAEIDELRGVSSRMMVANLMKRNLVKPVGRKDLPGRPLAYGTTEEFLRYFGLNRLSDLPRLSEIKEFSIDTEEER